MRNGNDYEPFLIDYGTQQVSQHMERGVFELNTNPEFSQKAVEGKQAPITAHLDGLITLEGSKQRVVLEAKTTRFLEDYGKPWSDEIPAHILCQVTAQMGLSGTRRAFVVVMGREVNIDMYDIPFDPELWKLIQAKCADFWWNHVVPQVQPEGEICLELLERIDRHSEDNAMELFGPDAEEFALAVEQWEQAKQERLIANKLVEERKTALLKQMGLYSVVKAGELTVEFPQKGRKVLKVHR